MINKINIQNSSLNFNNRITLQKDVQTVGEFGEVISTWKNIKTVWCKITTIDASQSFSKMKEDIIVTHQIITNFSNDAKECKRILFKDRVFQVISSYSPNEEQKFLCFITKELDNNS